MKYKMELELIIKYLEGKCTAEEIKSVESWRDSSEKNRIEYESIRKIWNTPPLPIPEPDVELALLKVRQKIAERSRSGRRYKQVNKSGLFDLIDKYLLTPSLGKAAVIIIFIFAFYFIFNYNTKPAINQVSVANKNILEIVLPDSSKVKLDSGSKFSYPEEFSDENRLVKLDGEALFEVTPNKAKPFIIETDEGVVTVLGTKFNVRTWNNISTVTVIEGKVSLSPKDVQPGKTIEINPGFSSFMEPGGNPSAPQITDTAQSLSWINREFKFENTELRAVINQVERWYDLKINLPSPDLNNEKVTVYIENKPIKDIINMIALVMDFRYDIDDQVVTFYKQ